MNKYYFNRKPKAAQTAEKEVKKRNYKSKPNLVKNSIDCSPFTYVFVMLCRMDTFGVSHVERLKPLTM